MLEKLKLAAGEMLSPKAVTDRMTRIDAELQAATARLQGEVKSCKRPAAFCTVPVFSKIDGAGSNGSSSRGGGPKKPERKYDRKK